MELGRCTRLTKSPFTIKKTDVVTTNCPHCDYLHFFEYKKIKAYGWKYQCRGCGEIIDIPYEHRKGDNHRT